MATGSRSAPAAPDPQSLTHRTILRFYTPLALSWVFMAVESPISIAIISRLGDPEIHRPAFLAMMALALWIESPVIDLLSTSTTLSRTRQSHEAVRKFTLQVMLWVTAVHALVVFTPIYGWVTKTLLNLDPRIAEATWVGLAIMVPWSACIGWRRYLQGVLIRNGETKMVGRGTALRVAVMAGFGFGLFALHEAGLVGLSSVALVAIALVASVFFEALFIHLVSRRILHEQFLSQPQAEEEPLSARQLFAFHAPLTLTTMVTLIGQPVITGALARAPDSAAALDAFPVAASLSWLTRTIVFALPEVVIALHHGPVSARVLRSFCIRVGVFMTGVLLLAALTGFDRWFFGQVLGAGPATVEMAHQSFLWGAALPMIGALQSYVRGMLTAHRLTKARLVAILVSMSALVGMLVLGVVLKLPGVVNAGLALTVAQALELTVLVWKWRRRP